MNSKTNIAHFPKKVLFSMRNAISFVAKFCQGYAISKHKIRKNCSYALHWHCFHPSLREKDENMKKKFSIEELTCLHLLRCHYADICNKEERELRETIALHPATFAKAKMICEKQKEADICVIPYYADDYPVSFAKIGAEAPALIHLLGNKELLYNENSVAIIGSRNADDVGCNIAYQLAKDYALKGNTIVSGLALGCDTAAHQGCIDANGKTIAVVASGLNIVHPKANESLQKEIIDKGGLIISEHPFGVKANPARLYARNRLQAALAQKVIVVQCAVKSGTMNTVHFAHKYGCKIYAVAYNQYDEHNAGNEYILKNITDLSEHIAW